MLIPFLTQFGDGRQISRLGHNSHPKTKSGKRDKNGYVDLQRDRAAFAEELLAGHQGLRFPVQSGHRCIRGFSVPIENVTVVGCSAALDGSVYIHDYDANVSQLNGFTPGNYYFGFYPVTLIDRNAICFSAVDANTIFVVGGDGKLWLERGPFGPDNVPPAGRIEVDDNINYCAAVNSNDVFVVDRDGNLWHDFGDFSQANLPPQDGGPQGVLVDRNAWKCSPTGDPSVIYILGTDGKLWLAHGPFGPDNIPPNRIPVDGDAICCSAIDDNTVYVLGQDQLLWLEH